jgi:cell division protein FtsB
LSDVAAALRSLAAERDALQAENARLREAVAELELEMKKMRNNCMGGCLGPY